MKKNYSDQKLKILVNKVLKDTLLEKRYSKKTKNFLFEEDKCPEGFQSVPEITYNTKVNDPNYEAKRVGTLFCLKPKGNKPEDETTGDKNKPDDENKPDDKNKPNPNEKTTDGNSSGNVSTTLPEWASSNCIAKSTAYFENGQVKHKNENGKVTVLNQDQTAVRTESSGECRGKWECTNSGLVITLSCGSGSSSSGSGSSSSGDDASSSGEYPYCVSNLQSYAGEIYGDAKDISGNDYTIKYTPDKIERNGEKGWKAIIVPKDGSNYRIGLYYCAGDKIVLKDTDFNTNLIVSEKGAKKFYSSADNAIIMDYYNDIPELFILNANKDGIAEIKDDMFKKATNTIRWFVINGYRGDAIGRYYKALPSMKKFLDRENPDLVPLVEQAEKDLDNAKLKFTQYDEYFDSKIDPVGATINDYKEYTGNVSPFDPAKFKVFIYKRGQGTGVERDERNRKEQERQGKYSLNETGCHQLLATYLIAIGKRNLVPQNFGTSSTGVGIDESQLEDYKVDLKRCNTAGHYDNKDWKKGRDALRYVQDPYKIDWDK
jgi:hypothetical protein